MIVNPLPTNTASIKGRYFCKACGWPVISTCCNDGMSVHEPYNEYDWWMYCSNKTCDNHDGAGYWQSLPEFVNSISEG